MAGTHSRNCSTYETLPVPGIEPETPGSNTSTQPIRPEEHPPLPPSGRATGIFPSGYYSTYVLLYVSPLPLPVTSTAPPHLRVVFPVLVALGAVARVQDHVAAGVIHARLVSPDLSFLAQHPILKGSVALVGFSTFVLYFYVMD